MPEHVVPAKAPPIRALPDDSDSCASFCTIHSSGGMGVTVWSLPERVSAEKLEVRLQLSPERPVIVGRQNGGEVPYLDPAYVSTPIVPGTGKTILKKDGAGADTYVSRGHFQL